MKKDALSFKDKVLRMTAPQIILAMVEGLRANHVQIDMGTFGNVGLDNKQNAVCFGCAATNMICQIRGKAFEPHEINHRHLRVDALQTSPSFLKAFEEAVNYLRVAEFSAYNAYAGDGGIAQLPDLSGIPSELVPPILTNPTMQDDRRKRAALAAWVRFAKWVAKREAGEV